MLKRGLIVLALVAIVALPFLLRPRRASPARADDTLILISPHNEAIRHEFTLGFQAWYKAKTGRTVFLDWRNVGGTSDIIRYLQGEYVASFRNIWTGPMARSWSAEIQSGFQNGHLPAGAPASSVEARDAFLASEASCGIDLFFGGGPFDFDGVARAGYLVDSGIRRLHPDWFTSENFPQSYGGEVYYDSHDLWFGTVLSSYGILYNLDSLRRLGFERPPEAWSDLTDPRFIGELGLCDPTKSGSIAAAFENVVQQQIENRFRVMRAEGSQGGAVPGDLIRAGWSDAMRLIQLQGANARYFTDTSQKPPIDVADGDCAAGMCIDFYGREQQEAVRRRNPGPDRVVYVSPPGGSAYSVDPIALLRGAPHPRVAAAFIEFTLSLDGQKLWNFQTGTPGGPRQFALRRLPVRRDFYSRSDWLGYRSDPDVNPYVQKDLLVHHDEWTGTLFSELILIVRVMTEDTHPELVRAWRAITTARSPEGARALKVLQDVSSVSYDEALGRITRAIKSKNLVEQVSLSRDLGATFRANYLRAERIAKGLE